MCDLLRRLSSLRLFPTPAALPVPKTPIEDTEKTPSKADIPSTPKPLIPSQSEPEMWPDDRTKRVVQAILSTFETGNPAGDYAAVAVLADGAGISYGKHQATDAGGNLDRILLSYLDAGGLFAGPLAPYVQRLADNETAYIDPAGPFPAWMDELMQLLRVAAKSDPLMQEVQDRVFDSEYWNPAVEQARGMKLRHPLSMAAVYDTANQSGFTGVGSLARIRLRFREVPPSRGGDEKAWTRAYLNARNAWLRSQRNERVRRSVVRVLELQHLCDVENWELETPFTFGPPYRVEINP